MPHVFDNCTFLITGGTGAWGRELTRQVLSDFSPKQVRIYSRGEHSQVDMRRALADPRVKFITGDIRDKNILGFAMKDVDVVFHLAALKHIPICEENCWEAVLTNIFGTQNVIETAIERGVHMVINTSTDKAVDPFNVYGITKACAEKLIINANQNYPSDTKFVCVRSGNVVGTSGSVVPLFKQQIHKENCITVTDPAMTRFLINTTEAIGLVLQALDSALGGEVFVVKMPATTLQDLAAAMVRLLGNKDTQIKIVGRRLGEKKHEVLISKNEVPFTKEMGNGYFAILPQFASDRIQDHYEKYPFVTFDTFTSESTRRLDKASLEMMLQREI